LGEGAQREREGPRSGWAGEGGGCQSWQRLIDGTSLARFAKPKRPKEPPVAQSARNRFPGIVTRVIKDRVAAQVEIQAGPHRLVSLLTREAVDELGLKPGMPAVAIVKATNVGVELPRD
jgi:molybdopterin-binding protein